MRSGLMMGGGSVKIYNTFFNFIFKENQGNLLTILAKSQSK